MKTTQQNGSSIHAIVGDPIAHSLSPAIYNTLYKRHEINISCLTVRVPKGRLSDLLRAADLFNVAAINVTIPHKSDIIPLMDSIDSQAKIFSAVNTVKVSGGKFYGYNTDASGFVLSLDQCGVKLSGKDVVLIGAGGAASSIAVKAAMEGARSVTIAARKLSAADALAQLVVKNSGCESVRTIEFDGISMCSPGADVVINATPLGMHGYREDFSDLSFIKSLPKSTVVCDIVYNPRTTTLLKYAQENGLQTVEGIGMLIWQAFAAFEIFHGFRPDNDDYDAVCEAIDSQK